MTSGLPNFLCVGAQKAGTTTLFNILKQHPDIFLPSTKEAHFFDKEERYQKGISWWISTFGHHALVIKPKDFKKSVFNRIKAVRDIYAEA